MDVILPDREVALLRQRVRDCARVGPAERPELVGGQPDDNFVLGGDDLEQVGLVLFGQGGLRTGQDENRQSGALQLIASGIHALALYAGDRAMRRRLAGEPGPGLDPRRISRALWRLRSRRRTTPSIR